MLVMRNFINKFSQDIQSMYFLSYQIKYFLLVIYKYSKTTIALDHYRPGTLTKKDISTDIPISPILLWVI